MKTHKVIDMFWQTFFDGSEQDCINYIETHKHEYIAFGLKVKPIN